MTRAQRERMYRNVYRVFAGVLAVSAVMAFFMNIGLFGISISWSGHELVITHVATLSEAGAVVGRGGVLAGQIELYTVAEVFRQDAELSYRATALLGGEEVVIPAREAQQTLVASIPTLGYWAYALGHPIGMLALIGIPLSTFVLDIMVVAWVGGVRSRVLNIRRALHERRIVRKEQKMLARTRALENEQEEAAYEERLVTRPVYREEVPIRPNARHVPETYGMTIRLTRPQRYSMNTQ